MERIGGHEPIRVDVRVIAATNQALPELIAQGRFREDLFYRLNVIPIEVPPLRRRREDIPLLVEHFLKTFSAEYGKRPEDALGRGDGVLHGVRLAGERARAPQHGRAAGHHDARRRHRARGSPAAAPAAGGRGRPAEAGLQSLREARDAFERAYILGELRAHEWNITRTAQALGIGRVNLWRKLKAYGIAVPRKGEEPHPARCLRPAGPPPWGAAGSSPPPIRSPPSPGSRCSSAAARRSTRRWPSARRSPSCTPT